MLYGENVLVKAAGLFQVSRVLDPATKLGQKARTSEMERNQYLKCFETRTSSNTPYDSWFFDTETSWSNVVVPS